ncbi:TetR/AcrR family transcriptional regulator [Streptomyces actinomycinicus]|uniref:TetR/AcrR family transcriptional regulator n=1 Tax=Streptomyces actinomycinicus TaxID=1695166 RepID=A0A937ES63_9ACTN|nr:TetR/AcrR family transcriptional regulator [Streptomyces actinomycinicus]MBL1087608.1 TetR/AcrR family transcriptional regulator [Streptomyces actinomycinicus]
MKQVRAVRTRRLIVQAAADEFDRHGYAGTPLICVTKAAGISMGALTFHFPTKPDLADAVQASGTGLTREVVARVGGLSVPPVSRARALVLSIARLLSECTAVRAAARLSRERSTAGVWADAWLACLTELLRSAHEEGRLRSQVAPEAFAESVQFLITGIEEYTRCAGPGADADPAAVRRVARAWDLLLYGASRPAP